MFFLFLSGSILGERRNDGLKLILKLLVEVSLGHFHIRINPKHTDTAAKHAYDSPTDKGKLKLEIFPFICYN